MSHLLTALVFILMAFSTAASADFFYNEGAFTAAVGNYNLETFEGSTVSGSPDSGGIAGMSFQWFDVKATPSALKILSSPAFGAHNVTVGGTKYLYADTDMGGVGSILTFTFQQPILAFATHLIDVDADDVTVQVPGQLTYDVASGPDGSDFFLGFLSSSPFNSLTIDTATDSSVAIDNVYTAVPEPRFPLTSGLAIAGAWTFLCNRRPGGQPAQVHDIPHLA